MIARNKPPVRIDIRIESALLGRNHRNFVRVLLSYRTFSQAWAFHPYCVANMPGSVPLTSSYALNNATLPFGLALANKGLGALVEDVNLRRGLNVHRGAVTHEAVANGVGASFQTPEQALAA